MRGRKGREKKKRRESERSERKGGGGGEGEVKGKEERRGRSERKQGGRGVGGKEVRRNLEDILVIIATIRHYKPVTPDYSIGIRYIHGVPFVSKFSQEGIYTGGGH